MVLTHEGELEGLMLGAERLATASKSCKTDRDSVGRTYKVYSDSQTSPETVISRNSALDQTFTSHAGSCNVIRAPRR